MKSPGDRLCGRKAALNLNHPNSEVTSCVKVNVAVLDLDHVALRPQKRGWLISDGDGGGGGGGGAHSEHHFPAPSSKLCPI